MGALQGADVTRSQVMGTGQPSQYASSNNQGNTAAATTTTSDSGTAASHDTVFNSRKLTTCSMLHCKAFGQSSLKALPGFYGVARGPVWSPAIVLNTVHICTMLSSYCRDN